MLDRIDRLAQTIEQDTPEDRDRYLDLLRVGAILVVVLGHWLARVIVQPADGFATGHLLEVVPATRWLTWVVQVMPLFFIVGGLLNLRSWRRARDRGTSGVEWVRNRARRLLRPLLPLLLLWVALASVLDVLGWSAALPFDAGTAITPVWFLAAYLVVTALTPVLAERSGVRVLVALVVGAGVVDALRFGELDVLAAMPTVDGQPVVAVVNFALVWVAVHQLGFWWNDDRLPRLPGVWLALAAGSITVIALLVTLGGYPVSVVQVPGDAPANDAPPTVALFLLGVAQLAIAVTLRARATHWLRRPLVWATVAVLGSRLMTVFLWHQTAMLLVATFVVWTDLWPAASAVDGRWLAQRPVWVAACAVVLVPLVVALGRFERSAPPPDSVLPATPAAVATAAAVLAVSASLGWLIVDGLTDPDGPLRLPAGPLLGVVAGMAALGVIGRGRMTRWLRRVRRHA